MFSLPLKDLNFLSLLQLDIVPCGMRLRHSWSAHLFSHMQKSGFLMTRLFGHFAPHLVIFILHTLLRTKPFSTSSIEYEMNLIYI